MGINLEECKLISNYEYMGLIDPQFVGQTTTNELGEYYMVFMDQGVLYKTFNNI